MTWQNKRLFIDLTALARTITGIENYTLNLCQAILKHCPSDISCYLLFRNSIHPAFVKTRGQHKLKVSPFKSQILTEQLYIPSIIKFNRFDVSFFPCFPPGLLVSNKMFIICYDATMWKYKETLSLKNKMYFKPLTENAINKANKIFTISESSKRDIEKAFHGVANNIVNLSAALPSSFLTPSFLPFGDLIIKFSITKKYILSVGSIEPRKNLSFLIRTVAPLLKRKDIQLVLVGRKAWGNKEVESIIKEMKIADYIITTGYISTQELQTLYRFAECFVFPSLYEGFGFPVLEAFACGCPVITSTVSSLPEVAGNAALLIDPTDGKALIESMENILENNFTRQELISKGKNQINQFSWDVCAKRFWDNFCTKDI
jgi:glycosyltransferase involved in cell wall biosynthesis